MIYWGRLGRVRFWGRLGRVRFWSGNVGSGTFFILFASHGMSEYFVTFQWVTRSTIFQIRFITGSGNVMNCGIAITGKERMGCGKGINS